MEYKQEYKNRVYNTTSLGGEFGGPNEIRFAGVNNSKMMSLTGQSFWKQQQDNKKMWEMMTNNVSNKSKGAAESKEKNSDLQGVVQKTEE